jgi:hypothetical protein
VKRLTRVGVALAATAMTGLAGAVPAEAQELMQVGLVMDRVGKIGSGSLTLTGRAFCSEEEALDLFLTIRQNPDRRAHWEQTVYCEGDTPFAATFTAPGFTEGSAFLEEAELCTNRGLSDDQEDCVSVSRSIDIQPK